MKESVCVIIFISLFSSCFEKEVSTENPQVNKNDTIRILVNQDGLMGDSWLNIIDSKVNNTLIFQTGRNETITSIAGYGNSEIKFRDDRTVRIDTFDFASDNINEYVFSSIIKGSTYGASVNYIIYYNTEWEVFRVPFNRIRIRFNKNAREDVIVSYKANGDSTIYRFLSGSLMPLF